MSDPRGFTLVELLVAIAMGSVVMLGASMLLISSLNVTGQVTGRLTALAEGRTGIEMLVTQLDSGCLVDGVSPVLASTTAGISPLGTGPLSTGPNILVFVSGVGDSATPTPTEHVVAVRDGALIDWSYPNTGGSPPSPGVPSTWTFSTTPSQVQNLAEHVTSGSGSMFTYEDYPTASPYSLQGAPALTQAQFPLTPTSAQAVAEVDLDIHVAPTAGGASTSTTSTTSPDPAGVTSELQDSAVFSLTANGSGSPEAPCQ